MALLGNLTGSSQFFNPGAFYNGVATQSLRFDEGSSPYLTRTPSGAGNQKTWTWSAWIKFSNVNHWTTLFASGSDNNNQTRLKFDDNGGRLFFDNEASGSSNQRFYSTRLFKDPSAWYNIVVAVDTTQATNTNRVKIYANGTQITAFAQSDYPAEDLVYNMNTTNAVEIGKQIGGSDYWDGYMADVNFIDGLQLTPSSFGEFKNGVWIPIDTSGLTFGTNGFKLKFDQTGVGTASTSTIGADTSGNTHHFTSSGIAASDCNMPDSPENNFATMNSIDNYNTGVTYSEGNLKWTIGSADGTGRATFVMTSGKWYTEFLTNADYIGVVSGDADIVTVNGTQTVFYAADGTKRVNSSSSSYGASYSDGDIIGIALNMDDEEVTFYKNNSSQGTISLTSVGNEGYTVSPGSGAGSKNATANFGQDSSFAGNKTAQGNTDANGIGDFYYAPPSGYLALCTSNLPEPTISPNADTQADDHFNTLIYDGNDDATRTFDVGFVSDFSWFKARNASGIGHQLYDSSRGVQKYLASNTATGDSDNTEGVTSFNSSGLLAIGNSNFLNKSGRTHVLWNWKANGGTTTTNDASATSVGTIDSVYQANTTAGFSIVTYTGTGSNATVAHGLGATPDMVIYKIRDTGTSWAVWHKDLATPTTGLLELNSTGVELNSASYWNSTIPTSTVLSIGTYGGVNASSPFIAYCFAGIEGYSKFGSYTGNGNADGTFVFTGFRPAWVMVKTISLGSQYWNIFDNVRDPFNDQNTQSLYANVADAEGTGNVDIDFLSNGMKMRDSGNNHNSSGHTQIYMAFAEAPFKYANAR